MNNLGEIQFAIIWGIGLLLQILILIGWKVSWQDITVGIFFSILSLLPRDNEFIYNVPKHIFSVSISFAFVLFAFNYKKLLPKVGEFSILLLTILFWYSVITFQPEIDLILLCGSMAIIPTFMLVYALFTKKRNSKLLRLILYIWSLIIVCWLTFINYQFIQFSDFYSEASSNVLRNSPAILAHGMASAYLLVYVLQIMSLIPFGSKQKSIRDKYNESVSHAKSMLLRYSNENLFFSHALIVTILFSGVLSVNLIFQLVPDFIAISIGVLLVEVLQFRFSKSN